MGGVDSSIRDSLKCLNQRRYPHFRRLHNHSVLIKGGIYTDNSKCWVVCINFLPRGQYHTVFYSHVYTLFTLHFENENRCIYLSLSLQQCLSLANNQIQR